MTISSVAVNAFSQYYKDTASQGVIKSVSLQDTTGIQWATSSGCILGSGSFFAPMFIGDLDQYMKPTTEVKPLTPRKLTVEEFDQLLDRQFGMFKDEKEYAQNWLEELRNRSASRLNDLYGENPG